MVIFVGWSADDIAVMQGQHSCSQLITDHTYQHKRPTSASSTPRSGASVFGGSTQNTPRQESASIGFGAPVADMAGNPHNYISNTHVYWLTSVSMLWRGQENMKNNINTSDYWLCRCLVIITCINNCKLFFSSLSLSLDLKCESIGPSDMLPGNSIQRACFIKFKDCWMFKNLFQMMTLEMRLLAERLGEQVVGTTLGTVTQTWAWLQMTRKGSVFSFSCYYRCGAISHKLRSRGKSSDGF